MITTGFDNQTIRLVIPSQTRYLNLVTTLAKRASMVAGFDDADAAKVSIAMDEAVTNIIIHAYKNDPDKKIEVELRFAPTYLEIHLLHSGKGLSDDQIKLPDPEEYIRHPRKGGLGLLLISRFMDEIYFSKNGAYSECRMIKRLE